MAQSGRDGGRTSRIVRDLLSVFVAFSIVAGFAVYASQDAIRTQVDLVVVPASIRARNGNLVSDLKREDFRLLEDGHLQEIRNVSFEYQPLSAVVLIESDVGAFFQRARPLPLEQIFSDRDEIAVNAFDAEIEKIVAFTNRTRDIDMGFRTAMQKSNYRSIAVQDRNLNSALLRAVEDLNAASTGHRKVIIVIGAGEYGEKAIPSQMEIQDQLTRNQIQVYSVRTEGHYFPWPPPVGIFRSYAESTGGAVYSASEPGDELSTALKRIVEEAHQHYVITYVSNNSAPAGGRNQPIHRIELKVRRSGVAVSHRKTY